MPNAKEPRARRVVLPSSMVKRIERDAAASGRRFSDQLLYVLTIGHRELDFSPAAAKVKAETPVESAEVARDGSSA